MITLIIAAILLVVVSYGLYTTDKRKYLGYPPGPPRLPLLGSLPYIPRTALPAQAMEKLAEIYGDVFHVKMGFVDVVVFNSLETVKAIITHDKAYERILDLVGSLKERNLNRNLGLLFSNGVTWSVLRPFTIRTLRDYGLGKAAVMDVVINEERDKLFQQIYSKIEANPQGGIQVDHMFAQTMTHIMWRLATGVGYELGDPKMERLVKIGDVWVKATNIVDDISIAYPFVWDMFPNWSGKKLVVDCVEELYQFLRETIEERRECEVYKTDPQNYVDVFLAKIDETKDDPNSVFNDDNLLITLLDLFQAGGESSSETMSFSVLYMLLHQNIQDKAWKEIDSVIGKDEMITADMKARLPYTHATLLEILRFSTIAPFLAPRRATEDFYFQGHLLKKGTPLFINIHSAHFTQSYWGDPNNFRPERFLNKEGIVDVEIAKNIKTFGDGRRMCLGRTLAESSLFIYFASIVRTFKLSLVPGQPEPSLDPVPGAIYSTRPFQATFTPRY